MQLVELIRVAQRGRRDFPDSSIGKESVCNAGDTSLIPGSGRSAEKG